MEAFIRSEIKKNTEFYCLFPVFESPGEGILANREAMQNYSNQIDGAIGLYEDKLKTGIATYNKIRSELNNLLSCPARAAKEEVVDSSLAKDMMCFTRLKLDEWQPVVDAKGHYLGMGRYNETGNEFCQYDNIGDLLVDRPKTRIATYRGRVPCKCKRENSRRARVLPQMYLADKNDMHLSSLGCNHLL